MASNPTGDDVRQIGERPWAGGVPALVALDLDGTLLDRDGAVTRVNAEAVARLRAAGALVVLATGRPRALTEPTAEALGGIDGGGVDYIVATNGAVLYDVAASVMLRDLFVAPDHPARIVDAMRTRLPGVGFAFEFANTAAAEEGWIRRLPPGSFDRPPLEDIVTALDGPHGPVRTVIVFHDDYDDDLPALEAMVSPLVDDDHAVEFSGLPFVEVGRAGCSKAAALAELCTRLGIAAADSVTMGDDRNDIDMLRWAGHGVAMGNAGPEVRAAADLVAPAHHADGVAATINWILEDR